MTVLGNYYSDQSDVGSLTDNDLHIKTAGKDIYTPNTERSHVPTPLGVIILHSKTSDQPSSKLYY